MRTQFVLAAALAVLAGCGTDEKPKVSAPGTVERACEDAADADPNVKHYWARSGGSNANPLNFAEDYKAARDAAIYECLRVRNGRPKGGVEKVIR